MDPLALIAATLSISGPAVIDAVPVIDCRRRQDDVGADGLEEHPVVPERFCPDQEDAVLIRQVRFVKLRRWNVRYDRLNRCGRSQSARVCRGDVHLTLVAGGQEGQFRRRVVVFT
jgi:hypothetical protein